MQQVFHEIIINTKGQDLYDFTDQTTLWVSKQKISNGILNIRKVAEIEKEKKIIIDEFINKNKSQFKSDNLKFSNKLKK